MASVRTQAPWMQHVPADFDEAADVAAEPLSHDECGDQQHQPACDAAWHNDEFDPADDDDADDVPPPTHGSMRFHPWSTIGCLRRLASTGHPHLASHTATV